MVDGLVGRPTEVATVSIVFDTCFQSYDCDGTGCSLFTPASTYIVSFVFFRVGASPHGHTSYDFGTVRFCIGATAFLDFLKICLSVFCLVLLYFFTVFTVPTLACFIVAIFVFNVAFVGGRV